MKSIILFLCFFLSELTFASSEKHILIFGKTIRAAHAEIIPPALRSLDKLFSTNGFKTLVSEDPNILTESSLTSFDSIVFLDVSEGVLNEDQKKAVENFIDKGKGLLSIHASISAGKDWPWYRNRIGTLFLDHPPIQVTNVSVVEADHPSMILAPQTWSQADEWYNFTDALNFNHKILATINENSYTGGKMGSSHPISWCNENNNSRVWYTAMGHSENLYADLESPFNKQILGAARWVSHLDE